MNVSTLNGRLLSRVRWSGALVAVAATVAMVALPGVARAEGPGNDPVSGSGGSGSSIVVSWPQGLLDNTNTAIASANQDRGNKNSAWWFLYQQFQNLQVTVSQTQNLGHQGITVSWSWPGKQTKLFGYPEADFLQMMECYGDATSGPTPEQCEYGSSGMLLSQQVNQGIGERTGTLCATATPSVTNPPRDRNGGQTGCDTQEPSDPTHIAPCSGSQCPPTPTNYTIPFSPVTNPTALDYTQGSTTYFSKFNSDEVQEAVTSSDGSGQQQFETLTGVQASGLGCGLADNNQPRGCWLVIVPRGDYDPNGFFANPNNATSALDSSPLSATNWAQRIQVHLNFAPVSTFCPIGTQEIQTIGTQVVTRAMQSWQLALNNAANCTKIYGYAAVPETTSTKQLSDPNSGVGLAFTTIPIGSEAARSGGSPPGNLPTILYAPVAIAALGYGFNININGYDATPVKLTPLLLAKSLTQSYRLDLPDYYPNLNMQGPSWSTANPTNITTDPAFQALNDPAAPVVPTGPLNPLLSLDHSQVNQQAWQWIQASSAATTWLGGTPDANDHNMVVDPAYQALNLGKSPAIDSFPRAYQPCLDAGVDPATQKHMTRCTLDLIPYLDGFDQASADVLTANDPDTGGWSSSIPAPDGTFGWWQKAGTEPIGNIFMWAFSDTPDMAAYGLNPAVLCDDSGKNCVGPTTDSVTAALNSAKADSSGLLHVDPANPGAGGYPLVDVIYAAVPTNLSAAALANYANLIEYAAGAGQTPGAQAGDLPPGYLPLPSNLQTQAQAVVAKLRGLATASPSPSPTASVSSASPTPAASTTSPGGDLGGNGTTTPAGTTGTGAAGGSATTAGNGNTGTGAGAGAGGTGGTGGGATSQGATHPTAPAPAPAPGGSLSAGAAHPTPSAGKAATAAGGPVVSLPAAQPVAGKTEPTPIGVIRWVLIVLIIGGGVSAVGGTVLRSRFSMPWPPGPLSRREKPR